MAKHGQTPARINENDPSGAGIPTHYTGREEAESPETATGEKEEEQKRSVETGVGKVGRR